MALHLLATLDVDQVCSHDDLANQLNSNAALLNLLPKELNGDSKSIRTLAFDDVVKALRKKTPPIYEADLSNMTELRDAVAYRAVARLYFHAMTTSQDGDAYRYKFEVFDQKAEAEIRNMVVTVNAQSAVGINSISLERR